MDKRGDMPRNNNAEPGSATEASDYHQMCTDFGRDSYSH